MRLLAISDIHTDYAQNQRWTRQLSRQDFQDDAIILAGDISDSLGLIEDCFEQFCSRFKQVFFVPGNHDLWVGRNEAVHSLEKFEILMSLADNYGVGHQPATLEVGNNRIDIVPLYSWYDFSFAQPTSELFRSWMDFFKCRWPDELESSEAICQHFLQLNAHRLAASANFTISFSHFVPRIDVMPAYIPHKHRLVYPVLGSSKLDEQIRQLGSNIHIYGHSHVNRDVRLDGIRYINNAFGYPQETWIAKSLVCVLSA